MTLPEDDESDVSAYWHLKNIQVGKFGRVVFSEEDQMWKLPGGSMTASEDDATRTAALINYLTEKFNERGYI